MEWSFTFSIISKYFTFTGVFLSNVSFERFQEPNAVSDFFQTQLLYQPKRILMLFSLPLSLKADHIAVTNFGSNILKKTLIRT